MSFKNLKKKSFLWTKMHFIHSFGPVSKGLGPVLDRFEIIIFFFKNSFVVPTFSAKIPEELLIKLVWHKGQSFNSYH